MSYSKLQEFIDNPNIADSLDDDELKKIGDKVVTDYLIDESSRANWKSTIEEAIKLAKQIKEDKTFPWPDASNVKYPLITMATIQLAANAYPQLIHNDQVVKAHVKKGVDDPDGAIAAQAKQISDYMSEQLLIESNTWEESMDKLLHSWPIVGTSFKKVYYDPITKKHCEDLCSPEDIIVNNNIKSLETARRITHRIYLHKNDVIERIRAGVYRNIDLDTLNPESVTSRIEDPSGEPLQMAAQDSDTRMEFLEQHNYLDLDDDAYQEPYITTVHRASGTVMRISARYDMDSIKLKESDDEENPSDEILRIEPDTAL